MARFRGGVMYHEALVCEYQVFRKNWPRHGKNLMYSHLQPVSRALGCVVVNEDTLLLSSTYYPGHSSSVSSRVRLEVESLVRPENLAFTLLSECNTQYLSLIHI